MNDDNNNHSSTGELEFIREHYLKLVDLHRELQNQNSILEERILSIVETYSNEKNQLEQDLIDSKQQIINLQNTVNELEDEKQRYKDDCNLAVRLLHRHPNEFISTTSEQFKNENESPSTNQSQHNVLIPTFPPIFTATIPTVNTTISSLPAINQTPTVVNDNIRLAESLFKSNTVHRYPTTHFICSNCYQTVKCCDVSVQTSLHDHSTTSDNGLSGDTNRLSLEPHNHVHITVEKYPRRNTRTSSHDIGLSSSSIPQMHHV